MKQKHLIAMLLAIILALCIARIVWGAMTGLDAHERYIYPVVRITVGSAGGSGTVIYSKGSSTLILTNHHVIEDGIKIEDVWDRDLGKNVKKEKLSIVYVEIFKYRNISIPVGTLKIEADIVAYNSAEDMALIKLRSEEPVKYVAPFCPKDKAEIVNVMDETIAVGCSLLFPPLPTVGVITRRGFQHQALEFGMSSSQIIYGNSGGALFLTSGELIGIPSLVAVVGWGTPVTHMGAYIPITRVYRWLEKEHFEFIWDPAKTEDECQKARRADIERKKEQERK